MRLWKPREKKQRKKRRSILWSRVKKKVKEAPPCFTKWNGEGDRGVT